jgi:hypothetical protein
MLRAVSRVVGTSGRRGLSTGAPASRAAALGSNFTSLDQHDPELYGLIQKVKLAVHQSSSLNIYLHAARNSAPHRGCWID